MRGSAGTRSKVGQSSGIYRTQSVRGLRRDTKAGSYRRALVRVGLVLVVLVAIGALAVAWLAHRADQAKSHLEASVDLIPVLQTQLVNGETDAAEATFALLRAHTQSAEAAATDPLWRAASVTPAIGRNFSAVTEVAVSASDVVERAVGPLIDRFNSLDWEDLSPVDGQIDLIPLQEASPSLAAAANTVELSFDRLARIDRAPLLPEIADPLAQATDELGDLSQALSAASSAASVLPSMLGADNPRNYLILIQNSAEVRATGGIPGALAVVSATDGQLKLEDQDSAVGFKRFDPAVIIDPAQTSIYSTRMGRFMQSVNLTPDFPTVAQTAARMWEERDKDSDIDGVVALDPVALANILEATGPVELVFEEPGVGELLERSGLPTSLTAENVVKTLLSDVYAAIENPGLQDAYFAGVAAEVFEALSSGSGEGSALVQSLLKSSEEGRLYVWSADAKEQEVIASTALAGSVTGRSSGGAAFGAYFNDGTAAKMDYYVRRTVQLERICSADGYLQYSMTATLTNTAPPDAALSLPVYVTGEGKAGVAPGTVQTNIVGYGPDQSLLQHARMNGEPVPLGAYRHGARPVGILTTVLAPGETTTVELIFTNVVQGSEPTLDVTPTIQPLDEVLLPLKAGEDCP